MTNFGQIKIILLLLSLAFVVVLVNSQQTNEQSNIRNVSLQDLNIDEKVKSALENGSVSEVVVRKDLLLFPVNAPDLVIAHTQEIHAVPHTNGSNTTDGKPTAAEIAEVNEYSLSQLVSTNDTDSDNETKSESSAAAVTATTLLRGPENVSVLEPGKLLEIVSGFNLTHGLATETIPLPDEVQNISIPKQSIQGLLSKSIQQSDTLLTSTTLPASDLEDPTVDASATDLYPYPYAAIVKRSADSEGINSSTDVDALLPPYPYIVRKRSIDSDEDDSDDDSRSESGASDEVAGSNKDGNVTEQQSISALVADRDNNSTATEEEKTTENVKRSAEDVESSEENGSVSTLRSESTSTSSTPSDTGILDNAEISKRSVNLNAKDVDSDSSSTTENHSEYKVGNSLEKLDSTANNTISNNQALPIISGTPNRLSNMKEKLRKDSHEDMEVAEDIVFRPLFRYRQETRLRQQSAAARNDRKYRYNSYDSDYDNRYRGDDGDY